MYECSHIIKKRIDADKSPSHKISIRGGKMMILVQAVMRRSCGGAGYPSLHVNVKPILTQDLGH